MPETTPFQVLVVDDHPLMRRGIRQLLELDPTFHVVAEAGDGATAIDLANRLDVDLILLDLNMKGLSGLDALNALRRDGVTAQIIILTVSDSASDVYALIDAGEILQADPDGVFTPVNLPAHSGQLPLVRHLVTRFPGYASVPTRFSVRESASCGFQTEVERWLEYHAQTCENLASLGYDEERAAA